jgi:hypothetical protein
LETARGTVQWIAVRGDAQAPINQQERVPMNMSFTRVISRLLIVCLIGLPFQVSAGMIGTDQVVSAAQAQAARAAVLSQVSRSDVAGQLQSLGLTPQAAKDRVAALTDVEVAKLAGQIEGLPAGADSTGVFWVIVIGVLIWWMVKK